MEDLQLKKAIETIKKGRKIFFYIAGRNPCINFVFNDKEIIECFQSYHYEIALIGDSLFPDFLEEKMTSVREIDMTSQIYLDEMRNVLDYIIEYMNNVYVYYYRAFIKMTLLKDVGYMRVLFRNDTFFNMDPFVTFRIKIYEHYIHNYELYKKVFHATLKTNLIHSFYYSCYKL